MTLEVPKPNQGHFVAVGFHGIGAMAFDRRRGTREPTFGQGGSLRIGESITDWLSLSLTFAIASSYGERRDRLTLGRFGVTSHWYLDQRCFIQVGFGASYTQGPDPDDYGSRRGRYGDSYLAGVDTTSISPTKSKAAVGS